MSWSQALPAESLRWAQAQAGASVVAALPMMKPGDPPAAATWPPPAPLRSRWLANHLLVLADGRELVLRRWARPGWDDDDPDLTAAREALVLERLSETAVPAPELVAADTEAAECDVPALLVSRVPGAAFEGRPPLGPMIDVLAEIHAIDPGGIPPYRRYYEPSRLRAPLWANDHWLWERAIAVAHEDPPDLPERFIHRDFHPGNTLWQGAKLTGVIDWTTGSRGPVAVDFGHLRWNLAVDYGQRVADAVPDHHPYYDIVTALDVVPEFGADTSIEEARRLEEHIGRALAELESG
jgi:aminoglycoside phosphotransferase (APT) family kinase protein